MSFLGCLPKKKRQEQHQKGWQPGARLLRCLRPLLKRRGGFGRGSEKVAPVAPEPESTKVTLPNLLAGGGRFFADHEDCACVETPGKAGKTEVLAPDEPAPSASQVGTPLSRCRNRSAPHQSRRSRHSKSRHSSRGASQPHQTRRSMSKSSSRGTSVEAQRTAKRIAKHKGSYEEAVRHSTQRANAADLVLAEWWPVILAKLDKYTFTLGGVGHASNGKMKLSAHGRSIALAASARDPLRLLDALDAADRCLSVPKSLRAACDSLLLAAQVMQCRNHIKAAVSRADSDDLVLWLEQAERLGLDVKPEKVLVSSIRKDTCDSPAFPMKRSAKCSPELSRSCRDSRGLCRAATSPPRDQSPVDLRGEQPTTVSPNATPRKYVPADGCWVGRPMRYRPMQSESPGPTERPQSAQLPKSRMQNESPRRPERPQSAQLPKSRMQSESPGCTEAPQSAQLPKSALPRQASKDRPPRPQSAPTARPSASPPPPPPQEVPPPPTTSFISRSATAELGSKYINSTSSARQRPASAGRPNGPSNADWMPSQQPNATPPHEHRASSKFSAPPRPVPSANPPDFGFFRFPRGSESVDGATENVDHIPQRPRPSMPKSNQGNPGAPRSRPSSASRSHSKAGASPWPPSAASKSPPPRAAPNYSNSPSSGSSADSNSPCDTPRENPAIEAETVRQKHLRALDLDINANPTEKELKVAYRQAALRYHPDRQHNSLDPKGAAEKFIATRAAYDYFLISVRPCSTSRSE